LKLIEGLIGFVIETVFYLRFFKNFPGLFLLDELLKIKGAKLE